MRMSYSQMNTYLTCGIKYEKRYIEKIPQLSTPALVAGKAFHAGIELNYKQKINTRRDLPVSDLKDCVSDTIEESFQEDLFLMENEKTVGKNKLKADWKDSSVRGIEEYHGEISPQVTPVGSECEFLVPLWDGHTLYGFIDVIDEKKIIRDAKTSRKTPARTIADTSSQLTAYAIAYAALYGELPQELVLDYIILKPEPTSKVFRTTRGPGDTRVFFKRLERVINGILREVFLPPTETWVCLYCQYRDLCPEKIA